MEEIEIEKVGDGKLGRDEYNKIENMLQAVTSLLQQNLKETAETRIRLEKLEEATTHNNKRLESLDSRIYFLTKILPSHQPTHHASSSHGPANASHSAHGAANASQSHAHGASIASNAPPTLHPTRENAVSVVKPHSQPVVRSPISPLAAASIATTVTVVPTGLPTLSPKPKSSSANASVNASANASVSDSISPLAELSPSEPKAVSHPLLPAISPSLVVEENVREQGKENEIEKRVVIEHSQEKQGIEKVGELEKAKENEKEVAAIEIEKPVAQEQEKVQEGEVEKLRAETEPQASPAPEAMETEFEFDPHAGSALDDFVVDEIPSSSASLAKELVEVAPNVVDIDLLLPENKRKGDRNNPVDDRHKKKSKSLDGTPIVHTMPVTTQASQHQNQPCYVVLDDSDEDPDNHMRVEEPKQPTATPTAKVKPNSTPARLSQGADEEATQSFEEESPDTPKPSSNARPQRPQKPKSNPTSPIVIPDGKPRVMQYKPDASSPKHAREKDGINLKKIYRGTIRSPVSYEQHAHKREGLLGQLILIWWPIEGACFIGQIRKWFVGTDDFSVHYFVDKKNVTHTLSQEQWCFVYDPD